MTRLLSVENLQEVAHVVILGVHLHDDVDVFASRQEALPEVQRNSRLESVVNDYLLVIRLVVLSIVHRLDDTALGYTHVNLCGGLLEGDPNQLIVALLQQLQRVFVSHLDRFEATQDLSVHDSQVIVHSLVEHHVVQLSVDLLSNCTQLLDLVIIDVRNDLLDFFETVLFRQLDEQGVHEVDDLRIVVVNAKVEAVEQGHRILPDVVVVLSDEADDLLVGLDALIRLRSTEAVSLLEPVSDLMVEVYFLAELLQVLLTHLIVPCTHLLGRLLWLLVAIRPSTK